MKLRIQTLPSSRRPQGKKKVLLIIWFVLLIESVVMWSLFKPTPGSAGAGGSLVMADYYIISLLVISSVLRWVVMPRLSFSKRRLPLFILGCALAEGALLSALLIPASYVSLFTVLSFVALLQYCPFLMGGSVPRMVNRFDLS